MTEPRKIPCLSLKGGTGKTTICLGIAQVLRDRGQKIGLLDVDIHASSLPKALRLEAEPGYDPILGGKLRPINYDGYQLFSIGLLFSDSTPNMWDGEMKASAVRQIATTAIAWDTALDWVIVDTPPTCLTGDTRVFTPDGPRAISEIRPGDIIYGFSGGMERRKSDAHHYRWSVEANISPTRVKAFIPQGQSPVYELRTNTRTIEATPDHPFSLLEREKISRKGSTWRLVWKPLKELKPGDHLFISHSLPDLPPCGPALSWNGTSNDMARLVGYFLGDGYIKKNSGQYRTPQGVLFAEPINGKFRDAYISLLKQLFARKVYEDKRQFGVLSRQVADQFIELGVNKPALQKEVPQWAYRLSQRDKVALLEGFCDADGHWRQRHDTRNNDIGNMTLVSANPALLNGLKDLAIYAGLRPGNPSYQEGVVTFDERTITSRTYHLEIVHPKGKSPRGYFGTSLFRARGRPGINPGLGHRYIGLDVVRSIKPVGVKPVFDIQLEGTHAFIANGIIVHNSGDEVQSLLEHLQNIYGAVIICQPNDLSILGITKTLNMLRETGTPIAGIVANMAGYRCPFCNKVSNPFDRPPEDVRTLAESFGLRFLGTVPFAQAPERRQALEEVVENIIRNQPITLLKDKGGARRWFLDKILK